MKRDFTLLTKSPFDVAIIGGGAMGAAIAWDAASRGLKTLLVEKGDFASGTSAASSKLAHGGLRYLLMGDVALVREGLHERRIWQRIAKHLVRPLPFLMPSYRTPLLQHKWVAGAGLKLYDLIAFDRNFGIDATHHMPSTRTLTAAQVLGLMPHLPREGLTGGLIYHDGQMLAPERLCLAMVQSAMAAGAVALNYAEVTRFITQGNRITGLRIRDKFGRKTTHITTKLVINASGAWSDTLLSLLAPLTPPNMPSRLILSKGIHFITRDISRGMALALPVHDEHLFVMPWQGMSLFATTDTHFEGNPDRTAPTSEDIAALLRKVQTALPGLGLTRRDIVYSYAGLRALVRDPSKNSRQATYRLSRRAAIIDHEAEGGPAGLISALGGKWTTARRSAAQVVDMAYYRLNRPPPPCRTAHTALLATPRENMAVFFTRLQNQFPHIAADRLLRLGGLYGAFTADMLATPTKLATELPTDALDGLDDPILAAQIAYGVEAEMAMKLDDIILRRVIDGQIGAFTPNHIRIIADYMATRLDWSPTETARQIAAVAKALNISKKSVSEK